MDILLFFLFVGVYIIGVLAGCAICRPTKKITQTESVTGICDESGGDPTIYVRCDYNPDDVKIFYEIPDVVAELVRPGDSGQTFVECLVGLINENEIK